MNRTLLSACFLDISELNHVFKFLDDLGHICGLYVLCFSLAKDKIRGESCVAYHEKILFNEDFSCVVFDECRMESFLCRKMEPLLLLVLMLKSY